jgi:formamidopyrimidine-DNA glycosylase
VQRRGKNILITLDNDSTLWVHLKMTGKFRQVDPCEPRDKHDLVLIDFAHDLHPDGHTQLRFNDYRRFGRLRLYPNNELWQQPGLDDLGPEPLEIEPGEFVTLCKRRPRMIKPALLDQSFIAGIGNIYADESLYAARIHPERLSASISHAKLTELHGHIQRLLKWSIDLMGTTVISYSSVNGQSGSFQKVLKAYGHEGEPCSRCGTAIVRRKMGSRSAHFCPRCQRKR